MAAAWRRPPRCAGSVRSTPARAALPGWLALCGVPPHPPPRCPAPQACHPSAPGQGPRSPIMDVVGFEQALCVLLRAAQLAGPGVAADLAQEGVLVSELASAAAVLPGAVPAPPPGDDVSAAKGLGRSCCVCLQARPASVLLLLLGVFLVLPVATPESPFAVRTIACRAAFRCRSPRYSACWRCWRRTGPSPLGSSSRRGST